MPTRRNFLCSAAAAATACAAETAARPNILWLTCEDIGPHLGAYGDRYADTPNLDRLAQRSTLYRNAWSNAPVCAPARTTIISGMYPTSTGSENMRSMTRLPEEMRMFPCYLRDAGYYATNNAKEDYNLSHTGQVWDESSRKGHWRNRKPGQPFFSVFNFEITHESQIRKRPHKWIHDPLKAPLPAYHPDTIEVRQDWAQYYDNITTMDGQIAGMLRQLEDDGLAEDTIVFFYGDHGSGMPRSKRWPYNSGLRVPLLVSIPPKFRQLASPDSKSGGASGRMVGFVDLAPTVLSLAGVRPPGHMQGHPFLGSFQAPPQRYLHGFRGRMDERIDMVRSVRDDRYIYIRNYMPHKIYGQHLAYMFETPTTRVWKRLYDEGRLHPPQTAFWETKPPEELYDLNLDKDEIHNLASSPEHTATLERLRTEQRQQIRRVRDIGFLPECEIHSRSHGDAPYEMGHDNTRYPLERIAGTAERASALHSGETSKLAGAVADPDSGVRYWAILGLLMRGEGAVRQAHDTLVRALDDQAPSVRIAAGEALGRYGPEADAARVLPVLMALASPETNGIHVSILALNALNALGKRADPVKPEIAKLPRVDPKADRRMASYAGRLIDDIVAGVS